MSAKLQHQHQYQHHQQHLKLDSNVASFGGSVTTTVSAAEGAGMRSVEKSAVLTERLNLAAALSEASLTGSTGSGDSASGAGDSSAASAVSSGVSTDSVELLAERRRQQPPPPPPAPPPQQQQRFASLLTVERGAGSSAVWVSHAHVTFRYRSDRLYYLDSAGRLHGPMDQREQCQVASVRRHATRSCDSGQQQPTVATRSHRAVHATDGLLDGGVGGLDGLLLLERRLPQLPQLPQQQPRPLVGGGGGGAVYSRVQVNQYDDWAGTAVPAAPIPRSYSQQLEFGDGGGGVGGGFVHRQYSRESHRSQQQLQPQQQQHHQQYYRSSTHQRHHRGAPQPQHPPGFDARLEHLERSLNQAMESIRRQASSTSHHRQHHQQHHRQQQGHQEEHRYIEHQGQTDSAEGGQLRRFNSEPPFEFRYSQRTMTHEPPQVTEEVETTTLQPIGRGIHDLGSGTRVTVQQQSQQQQHSSATVTRSGRLAVRQDGGTGAAAGRSLSANRNATLRASTPVSPKFQQQTSTTSTTGRGRHLSAANTPRGGGGEFFAQVY